MLIKLIKWPLKILLFAYCCNFIYAIIEYPFAILIIGLVFYSVWLTIILPTKRSVYQNKILASFSDVRFALFPFVRRNRILFEFIQTKLVVYSRKFSYSTIFKNDKDYLQKLKHECILFREKEFYNILILLCQDVEKHIREKYFFYQIQNYFYQKKCKRLFLKKISNLIKEYDNMNI